MVKQVLGILSYVGMALVFGAVAVRVARPEWDQYAVYAAWTGLALVLLYTLGQWRDIVDHFRRRQARYGAIASVTVVVALAILVLGNWLSYRQNKRWDLTANRQYSLSDQTVRLLEELDAPLKVMVFDRSTEFDAHRSRLEQYRYHSPNVSLEYIDADRRPVETREYDIQTYGTIVLEYMDRREQAASADEGELTNKLIRLLNPEDRKVYFLQGHGEKDPTSNDPGGYASVAAALRRDNYEVERLALLQQKEVPEDATGVIVAGPTSDLLPEEIDALRRYLERGGKLMVLVDPQVGAKATALPSLTALVRDWGIEVGDNVVVDVTGLSGDPSIAAALMYPSHPITERMDLATRYPLARSVEPVEAGVNGRVAQPVVQTSEGSWAETNLALSGGVQLDEGQGDRRGPITIASAVSAPVKTETPAPADDEKPAEGEEAPRPPETRLVVFGDSDFVANGFSGAPGNLDLFANAVNWMSQQENLIAIRPREAADRRISLTPGQMTGLFWLSIVLVPAAVLGAGVFTWWRRR